MKCQFCTGTVDKRDSAQCPHCEAIGHKSCVQGHVKNCPKNKSEKIPDRIRINAPGAREMSS